MAVEQAAQPPRTAKFNQFRGAEALRRRDAKKGIETDKGFELLNLKSLDLATPYGLFPLRLCVSASNLAFLGGLAVIESMEFPAIIEPIVLIDLICREA